MGGVAHGEQTVGPDARGVAYRANPYRPGVHPDIGGKMSEKKLKRYTETRMFVAILKYNIPSGDFAHGSLFFDPRDCRAYIGGVPWGQYGMRPNPKDVTQKWKKKYREGWRIIPVIVRIPTAVDAAWKRRAK